MQNTMQQYKQKPWYIENYCASQQNKLVEHKSHFNIMHENEKHCITNKAIKWTSRPTNWLGSAKRDVTHPTATRLRL